MSAKEYGQIILNNLDQHVKENLVLDDSFMITDFKARNLSITFTNPNYEVTVKVCGEQGDIVRLNVAKDVETYNLEMELENDPYENDTEEEFTDFEEAFPEEAETKEEEIPTEESEVVEKPKKKKIKKNK